ncbi:MAG: winged helix-turn-helix transcriptional regulator [Actinobacteria bacterium]|nr:winged helix-turn-helix transcriptional regulator [Actinomycetota bacterium]
METNGHPLDALGDPTRRQVFELLRSGPRSVGDLAADVPVSRPAVSQHLRVLEDAGLVTHRRNGTRNLYELDGAGVAELRSWVDDFWNDALARFTVVVEEQAKKRGAP